MIISPDKQKSFYEDVVQIGTKDDTGIGTLDGEIAARCLTEYTSGFQQRNPNFYVFNAVPNMDEARTAVLKKIVISELNKMLECVKSNEDEFIRASMENSVRSQKSKLKNARKLVKQYEKRVAEPDKLFTRLYEDNVSGKISDERFDMMSKGYEDEQAERSKI